MSARTDMFDELTLRLASINGAVGGYNYSNRQASWTLFKLPDEVQHYPVTYLFADTTRNVGGQIGPNNQSDELPVVIWGYIKAEREPHRVAERFLEDMLKAIAKNRVTGGQDLTLDQTCAAFLVTSKDISGDLTSERRTIEVILNVRLHGPVGG